MNPLPIADKALTNFNFGTKLPLNASIYGVMKALAQKHQAVDLSQGSPDFEISEELFELAHYYMKRGMNQYTHPSGCMQLRENISKKLAIVNDVEADPAEEITITTGASEAIAAALIAMIHPGDEVIIMEPAFDFYKPKVLYNNGIPVFVPLNSEDFSFNWEKMRLSITDRTKAIIINTPHNPAGVVMQDCDWMQLAKIVRDTNILIISDEVYDTCIFDGLKHQSILQYEELRQRAVAVFSLSKTYCVTGWRIGYCISPAWLTHEIRKVRQFMSFSAPTPMQYAFADFMGDPENYLNLTKVFQQKRDYFLQLIEASELMPMPCHGSFFMMLSYKHLSDRSDEDVVRELIQKWKIACIPMSAHYHDKTDNKLLRFCFMKKDETLEKGARILCELELK